MENIKNIHDYNTAMKKTLLDKVWFLDKIDKDTKIIIDFGGADGSMIKFIEDMFPNHFHFVYVDNNEEMRKLAKQNLSSIRERVTYVYSLDTLRACLQPEELNSSVLVLNSVLHEVLSYCSKEEQNELFEDFFLNDFKYIAIRDMHLFDLPTFSPTWVSEKDLNKYIDFCENHNTEKMTLEQQYVEFLLKTDYYSNWERERDEKYLWDWTKIISSYTCGKYLVDYEEEFSLPYHRRKWKRKFNVSTTKKIKTHKKMLLRGC